MRGPRRLFFQCGSETPKFGHLAQGEFQKEGGLCGLESWRRLSGKVQIEGKEELNLGEKTTFQKGKHLNGGMKVAETAGAGGA